MIVKYFASIYIWFYYNWSQLFTIHNLNYSLQITTNLNHVIVSLLDIQYWVYLFPPLCHDVFCVSQCTSLHTKALKFNCQGMAFLAPFTNIARKSFTFKIYRVCFLTKNIFFARSQLNRKFSN